MKRVETRRESTDQIGWAVVGEKGAIEYWRFREKLGFDSYSGGVETHSRTPFSYSDETPDHEHCKVLDGPCWHDGTSLWASKYWIPHELELGEAWVWVRLEQAYRESFEDDDGVS